MRKQRRKGVDGVRPVAVRPAVVGGCGVLLAVCGGFGVGQTFVRGVPPAENVSTQPTAQREPPLLHKNTPFEKTDFSNKLYQY